MGKYTAVVKDLELAPPTDPKKWQKVIQRRQELFQELSRDGKPPTSEDLDAHLVLLRKQKAELEEALSINDTDETAIEQILLEQMEKDGRSSMKLNNGATIFIKDSVYPSFAPEAEVEVRRVPPEKQEYVEDVVDTLKSLGFPHLAKHVEERLEIGKSGVTKLTGRDAFNRWVEETNQEELFTVNWNTMKARVGERMVNGQPIPPGIKAYKKSSINRRKPTER